MRSCALKLPPKGGLRPAVPFRRVTPSSTAHKNIPVAPGRKAIGEVREFKVVPDHLGRGRPVGPPPGSGHNLPDSERLRPRHSAH